LIWHKGAILNLQGCKAITSQESEPFEVYARVVEDLADKIQVIVCTPVNNFCKNVTPVNIRGIMIPKKDVLSFKRIIDEPTAIGAEAAGGAKKKSRRRKQRKPSKTKRNTRRPKNTRKRRA